MKGQRAGLRWKLKPKSVLSYKTLSRSRSRFFRSLRFGHDGMAQGSVISMTTQRETLNGVGAGNGALVSSLPDDNLGEISQYEKLLRFCDEVSRGTHPRIKPKLSQLHGKPAQETASSTLPRAANPALPTKAQNNSASSSTNRNQHVVDNSQSFQTNGQHAPVTPYPSLPGLQTLSSAAGDQSKAGSGKVEINPVLLEKSDALRKAEIHLQRQRVERALKEQLEQRRVAQRAAAQAEDELDSLDIMDVLTRALSVVRKTPAENTDDIAANNDASSDSFDDNTFYSSQHDTPQSQQLSRLPDEPEDEQMRDASPYEPEFEPEPATIPSQGRDAAESGLVPGTNVQSQNGAAPSISTPSSTLHHAPNTLPGLSSEATSVSRAFRQLLSQEGFSSQGSGPASRSEESLNTGPAGTADSRHLARINEQLLGRTLHPDNSPVVRAHDLSPVAPQPAHVSPLVVVRQQQLASSDSSGPRGTLAQVAALRNQPSAATSPESSPQGSRAAEKKKNKKKKRKADKLAAETAAAASPYIKPEPRSPSPLSAQPYLRPAKRRRQQHQRLSAQQDPRFDHAIVVDDNYGERYPARPYRDARDPDYRPGNEAPRQETEHGAAYYPTVERVYYDDPRLPPAPRQGPSDFPGGRPVAYVPHEVRGRRSVSKVDDGSFGDATTYVREAPAVARVSSRPTGYRERSRSPVAYQRVVGTMGPPGPPTIIVDQFGREYIEPPRPRLEQRPVDAEALYGRPPPSRAISRRPDPYEDDTAAYRPVEGTYPAPRRVVTQPELAGPEPRDYRERAYSTHIMRPPAGEYLPPRPRADTRGALEPAREYMARPASARPLPEQGRYDGPPVAYDRRPPDDYYPIRATSVRPPEGTRYEMPIAYERRVGGEEPLYEYTAIRSASVRPAEPIRYEVARDYPGARVASVRPELSMGADYTNAPPPARAFSVHPGEGAPLHYMRPSVPGVVQSTERYYGRPPAQNDEEVVYLDRPPREVYRQMR
ncbi:hypothetical protein V8F33_010764 [Rhypophila sp. PSN 637]